MAFVTITVHSQKTWTLNECILYAIKNNLELNDLKLTEDSETENYQQSYRNLLPKIQATADYDINYGRSLDPITNNYLNTSFYSNIYILSASVDIFKGFQKINMIKASKLLRDAVKEETQQEKYMLAFRIMSAYYDILFYEEFFLLSKEQLRISEANYDFVKRKLELGLLAGAYLYDAESIVASDKLALAQSQSQLKEAKLRLIQEMNLEEIRDIKLKESTIIYEAKPYEIKQDSIYENALAFMPLIKSGELQLDVAEKEINVARSNMYPSLTFAAAYGSGFFETLVDNTNTTLPFWTQIDDNASGRIGFNLTIPIFNGWSVRSKVRQKKIEFQRFENKLNMQKQELYKLIQELVQNQKTLENELEFSSKKVKAQEISFDIAQKKYRKGMISALELYRAKNFFANAQSENLQVKIRLKVNRKTLDFYNGLPIFTNVITK